MTKNKCTKSVHVSHTIPTGTLTDPTPTSKISYTVHVCYAECQKTGEGACDGGGGEEEGLAELRFVAGVPHCYVVGYSGEQTVRINC